MERHTSIIVIGSIAAVLLQVIVAPNIAIFSALPSFIIVFSLVVSMLAPGTSAYVCAFVLGMIGDLLGYGPVGALPFLLLIAAFCVSAAYEMFNNDTVFIPLIILVVFALLVELLYAGFVLANGLSAGPLEAFIYRALPCALYDSVIGLVVYAVMVRLFDAPKATMSSVAPKMKFH